MQHTYHKDFDRHNAKELLSKASTHSLQVNWTKAAPSLLFSFLWQLWQASCHFSASDPSHYFPEILLDKVIDLLKGQTSKKKHQNPDKITLYALVGLLIFIQPEKTQELRYIIKGKLLGLDYLRDEINTALCNRSLGFITAYFALYGMGLVCHPSRNFTIQLRMALKARFLECTYMTQAVKALLKEIENFR